MGASVSPAAGGGKAIPPQAERPGSVVFEETAGPIRVRLAGAIDAVLAPRLDAVVTAVAAGQPADVRLELAEVDFLGSHGMAFLVRVQHTAGAAGRRVRIEAISPSARLALRIAGLEEFFLP